MELTIKNSSIPAKVFSNTRKEIEAMADRILESYGDYYITCEHENFRVSRSEKNVLWGISMPTYKTIQEARDFIDGCIITKLCMEIQKIERSEIYLRYMGKVSSNTISEV